MPRDNDKNNDSRGRRDRPSGGKGRSGAARGPDKKFAKRGFAGKSDGGKRPYAGKPDGAKSYGKKPYAGSGKPYAGKREGAPPRRDYDDAPRSRDDRPFADRPPRSNRDDRPRGDRAFADRPSRSSGEKRAFTPRDDRGGEKRPYSPRGDRPNYNRDDRAPRSDRSDARPAARFSDKKFGDKRPYTPRDGGGEKRPYTPRGEGSGRKFGGEKKFSRGAPDRGPRKDFGNRSERGPDRGESKPWQKRDASSPDHAGRNSRPKREGERNFDKPRFDKPRYDRPREDRPSGDRPFRERPKFDRPREGRDDRPRVDRPQGDRARFDRPHEDRPKFDRPREARGWQEHPRSEARSFDRNADRPRRDNEDDSKIFTKRPAFGGRGAYRERMPDERRPPRPPREKKSGERIAKVVSRAGLASRRDAEEWIVQGRVTVNGRVINSPALDVTANDVVTVDGKPLPPRERTRLFMYHKPRGLMTTHADPEGRPTVFDNLPEGLPRLISIGRLDFNTEGLLLLTNDGGLARALELPDTGWLRRYRVRAHGEVTQAQLDELKKGIEVDGVKYGPIDATLERDQGANVWLVFAIREGKNREVRNVLAHLGLEVNRLIRVSYGPFQLGELAESQVEEVKTRVLREQLGEKIAALAGADFNRPMPGEASDNSVDDPAPRGKKPFKPAGKSGLIADRKGRRVLVQRTGSDEARARNEAEANGYGPPRRPQRGYHGKRDLKPRDE
ncbi:pseudouridine synthase [Bradyrhizobium sp. URHD0069]|uniref:pseudouridine synthase n=1 Tax=Bradyrhizobium sp. URHD0069 TaxID=1380355 RepID=UPI0004950762|nr:pseudouridine synthase [Bradyrhizobium sp. URHD0069]